MIEIFLFVKIKLNSLKNEIQLMNGSVAAQIQSILVFSNNFQKYSSMNFPYQFLLFLPILILFYKKMITLKHYNPIKLLTLTLLCWHQRRFCKTVGLFPNVERTFKYPPYLNTDKLHRRLYLHIGYVPYGGKINKRFTRISIKHGIHQIQLER